MAMDGHDVVMGGHEEDPKNNIQDTSFDTETWDKLGVSGEGELVVATQDTAVSIPPLARLLGTAFDEYGPSCP